MNYIIIIIKFNYNFEYKHHFLYFCTWKTQKSRKKTLFSPTANGREAIF